MVTADAFRHQPVLAGDRVRLEPLTETVLEDYLRALNEPEVRRLTGSHTSFDRPQIERWLSTRQDQHSRADWAIVRLHDGAFLGEAVLLDLSPEDESASYRIWLAGPQVFGLGYGTEVTRLVVEYALDVVGLHRLGLAVFDFNPRARRVNEKCGFIHEGRLRDGRLWQGKRYDTLLMSILQTDPRRPMWPAARRLKSPHADPPYL